MNYIEDFRVSTKILLSDFFFFNIDVEMDLVL